ncbi:MAG: hypothetical protein LQ340_003339 [Diploschistes diacapsis]|nr:MAG: hypothetical protein LQ340_003339 [Diploschistes diacapsis]
MDITSPRVGLWRDYSRGPLDQWQLLIPDYWAQWILAFVAVWLTLSTRYLGRIQCNAIVWLYLKWTGGGSGSGSGNSNAQRSGQTAAYLEQEHLLPNATDRQDYGTNHASNRELHGGLGRSSPESRANATSQPRNASETAPISLPDEQRPTLGDNYAPNSTPPEQDEPRDFMVSVLESSESNRQIVWRFVRHAFKEGFEPSQATGVVFVTSVLFGLFIAWVIAGLFSARIATDRAALSSSTTCGIWQFDDEDAGDEAAYRDQLHDYHKEATAGQYARNCYNGTGEDSAACSMFYQQSIPYYVKRLQECPFSAELCAKGLFTALELDTGQVDAMTICVNARPSFKFRRNTVCSPLNMSSEYIKQTMAYKNVSTYRYYYGPTEHAKYTFETTGDAFQWLDPAYSVK